MDWWICFFILLFCTVMYLLYIKGLAVSKSIQAILCVFRPGKDADRATLDSCTGWVRHVGRFHGDRTNVNCTGRENILYGRFPGVDMV